jgi:hypothetical protein
MGQFFLLSVDQKILSFRGLLKNFCNRLGGPKFQGSSAKKLTAEMWKGPTRKPGLLNQWGDLRISPQCQGVAR